MLYQLDLYLFRLINNLAGQSDILDWFFYFSAKYLIFVLVLLVLVLFFYYLKKEEKKLFIKLLALPLRFLKGAAKWKWEIIIKQKAYTFLFSVIATVGLAWFLEMVINFFYFRPRPFISLLNVHQLIFKSPLDPSFPSGHATVAFAIAFAVFLKNKVWGSIFLILAVLIGVSRIFVGVHYPLDIAAGVVIALLASLVIKLIIKKHYGK